MVRRRAWRSIGVGLRNMGGTYIKIQMFMSVNIDNHHTSHYCFSIVERREEDVVLKKDKHFSVK